MKIKTSILYLLTALLCTGLMTSCKSNDDGVDWSNVLYDICTLTSSNPSGSTVTLRKDGDSPLVTLTFANQQVDTERVAVGERFLIAYIPESGTAYESGPALMYGYMPIYNGVITEGTKDSTDSWATMMQSLQAMWRTGEWINIQTICTYSNDRPARYELVVDKSTLSDDYPRAYLLYEADDDAKANTKEFYASFNIADVWELDHIKGLSVNIYSDGEHKVITFQK